MALGLEKAGFQAVGLAEIDRHACATLRANRPSWRVLEADVRQLDPTSFQGVDLFAGGVPCPPFSVAGKQLGAEDDRDLFPTALEIIERIRPKSVFLENVPGFASNRFMSYRRALATSLNALGYWVDWAVLNASDYGVPQLRPRFILVALRERFAPFFEWPIPSPARQTSRGVPCRSDGGGRLVRRGRVGQTRERNRTHIGRRLQATRRSRSGTDPSSGRLAKAGSERNITRGRGSRAGLTGRRDPAPHRQDDRPRPGVSRLLASHWPEDRRIPAGRQRPATACCGGRGPFARKRAS